MGRLCTLGRWYLTFLGFRVSPKAESISLPRCRCPRPYPLPTRHPSSAAGGFRAQGRTTSSIRGEEGQQEPRAGSLEGAAAAPPSLLPFSVLPLGFPLPHSSPAVLTGCLYEPTLWAGDPSGLSLHPQKTFPLGSLLSSYLHALPKKTTVFTPSKTYSQGSSG